MRKIFYFILVLFFASQVYSQRVLKLDEALSIALKESYNIQSANYSLINSQKSLEAQKLGLRSLVSLSLDVPSYSRSIISSFDETTGIDNYYSTENTSLQTSLNINQPILFTNGTLTLSGILQGKRQLTSNADRADTYYSNLVVSLTQPLFQINTQARSLEKAEINLEKAQRNFTQAEQNIIYSVSASFYNLVKSKKSLDISREKVRQTEESYNTASNKFKAGLIPEDQLLQLEVDLASSKNELLSSIQSFEDTKNDFKILIGLPLTEEIDVEGEIEYKAVNINVEEAVVSALKKRPDILNAENDVYLSELAVEETDARSEIKANLKASFGVNKNANQIENVFNHFADTRNISLNINVPVLDWGKNAREVEASEASYRQSKLSLQNSKDNIRKEIISAANKLNSCKARVEVLSKTVDLAEKSYHISMERFKVGNITSTDLAQSQLRLTEAKLSSLSALIEYKLSIIDLERKTLMKIE
jgi:outer membrane protein TolC